MESDAWIEQQGFSIVDPDCEEELPTADDPDDEYRAWLYREYNFPPAPHVTPVSGTCTGTL